MLRALLFVIAVFVFYLGLGVGLQINPAAGMALWDVAAVIVALNLNMARTVSQKGASSTRRGVERLEPGFMERRSAGGRIRTCTGLPAHRVLRLACLPIVNRHGL